MVNAQINTTANNRAIPSLFAAAATSDVKRIKALLGDRIKRCKTLHSEVIRITPAMAEYIISNHNKRNRAPRQERVKEYRDKIEQGRMKLHSQGISFAVDGNLNNGQHRLLGVIAAGVPCDFYVTFGEDVSAFDVIDTCKVRSAKDALFTDGYKNNVALAAAARILIVNARGAWLFNNSLARVDNDEIVDFVNNNPSIVDCLMVGNRLRQKLSGSCAPLSAAIFLIRKNSRHPERLDEFLDKLSDGADLPSTSPILRLRDGIQSRRIADEMRNTVARNANIVASFIIAWNKWNKGQSGSIKWANKEIFPQAF